MSKVLRTMAMPSQEKELTFGGLCQSVRIGQQTLITIEEIANQRDTGNLSGTLAIELWALNKPYQGGEFDGQLLAATTIGEIRGQHHLPRCRYQLNYSEPTTEYSEICLMLREWQGDTGFVTKDFVVMAADTTADKAVEEPLEESEEKPLASHLPAADQPVDDEPVGSSSGEQQPPKSKAETNDKVSINSGSYEELHGIKGVNKKLAQKIIAGRPYRKKKALLQLPSVTKKKFKKIKPLLRR